MEFGCVLQTRGNLAAPSILRGIAQHAEQLAFDSVWVSDHIAVPVSVHSKYPYSFTGDSPFGTEDPYIEAILALTYVAANTNRIKIGPHVLVMPYRNPLLIAKQVAALDYLSEGRVILGVGVGWMEEEFKALGLDYFSKRGAVTDEQIQILKKVWTERTPSHEGEFYQFQPISIRPFPVQSPHPPIWVGGHSKPAIRRAARLGNGWLPIGLRGRARLEPNEFSEKVQYLRVEIEKAKRDPASVKICFSTGLSINDKSISGARIPFEGSYEQVAEDINKYNELGVEHFILSFPGGGGSLELGSEHENVTRKAMETFSTKVMSQFK